MTIDSFPRLTDKLKVEASKYERPPRNHSGTDLCNLATNKIWITEI